MAKKSKCSPNMTYVLCLVIVGLIVYLLYNNYKESFYSETETVLEIRKKEVKEKQEEKKKAEKELKEAKEKLEEAKKEKANESKGETTRRYPKV